ncbi:DNA-directed RNA polymerase II [Atractiella rhizophila]|nr:DNA-directed RNA polymerase II [Atractiella rhizophila]
MNAPTRYELFNLAEGENRLQIQEDTKIPNAATITVNKEDWTIANLLRSQLLLMDSVLFAGVQVPHPLEPRFVLKVQTDGSLTPIQAVKDAITKLVVTLDNLRKECQNKFNTAKVLHIQGQQDLANGYGGGIGEEYGGL